MPDVELISQLERAIHEPFLYQKQYPTPPLVMVDGEEK
jgi:hypothetical protein